MRHELAQQLQDKNVIQQSTVEQALARQYARLRICLQHITGDGYGPEEGSDAWLLLHALTDNTISIDKTIESFEQSGRWLAEQGGKLDTRLQGLQKYIDALALEMRDIFSDQLQLLVAAHSHLYQLQSACTLALARGYQTVMTSLTGEREQMEQQLERRLSALQQINGASNSIIDLDQALEITANAIAEELHADLCSIFFYDEVQRMLTLRSTNGPRPLGGMHFTLRLGEGYSGWVADKGRPLLVFDALADPHFASEARTYTTEYHGLMSVPIIFFGDTVRLIGVISVQSVAPRDFTKEEISFVEVVAGIIAINIENGRLYEQTDEQLRRKVHELSTIHRVSSIIASTLNLQEVLQIITTQAVHLAGAERSCIFELDAEKQELHVLAHYGLNSNLARNLRIPVTDCCAGRTVTTGEPTMAVDCFHTDKHCFIHNDPLLSADIHSVVSVPLRARQKVLGCICLYSSRRHLPSPEQMQLVVTFANEAAIAIENARLYEETLHALEIKSILLRELHHRVKNNLATVAGILSLQRRRTKSPEVRYTLSESVNRVQGLAATHDLLSHEDVDEARVDDIGRKIVGVASANLQPPGTHITFEVEPCPIVIPSRAVTILALVLNEMVSNAIKHGMARQSRGKVIVRGYEEDDDIVVQVIDTGKGPLRHPAGEEESSEGLGVSLIKHLIGDLGGQYSLRRVEEEMSPALAKPSPVTGPQEESHDLSPVSEQIAPGSGYTIAEVRFPTTLKRKFKTD
ncbi:MAG TPA: GAF domain-containing protein [Ktedonobacteraceae bacterium]|nr:GAF domain-containing protein [Ktedonobacteraceae bacterium]